MQVRRGAVPHSPTLDPTPAHVLASATPLTLALADGDHAVGRLGGLLARWLEVRAQRMEPGLLP